MRIPNQSISWAAYEEIDKSNPIDYYRFHSRNLKDSQTSDFHCRFARIMLEVVIDLYVIFSGVCTRYKG